MSAFNIDRHPDKSATVHNPSGTLDDILESGNDIFKGH